MCSSDLMAAGENALKRLGVRAGVGATQGALFSAAMQPLTAYAHTQEGRDYTMVDALHAVLMGAGLFTVCALRFRQKMG